MEKISKTAIFNAMAVIFGVAGIVVHIFEYGWLMFQYYTLLSNLFCTLACLACLIAELKRGEETERTVAWKYLSCCTVAVTLVIVFFVLSPMASKGWNMTLLEAELYFQKGGSCFHHLLCPLTAILSFIFADRKLSDKRLPSLALIFTTLYGIIIVFLNWLGVLTGPYPFLEIRKIGFASTALWMLGILIGSFVIAEGIFAAHRRKT